MFKSYLRPLLWLFFLVPIVTNAQKMYTLKFNPPNGSNYSVGMTTKTKVLQNVMGQDMEIKMDMDLLATYGVTDETPNKKLSITYDKMKMMMDVMGQQLLMDSDDADTTKRMNEAVRALIGKTIDVILTPQGKVLSIAGTEAIINSLTNMPEQREAMKNVMGEEVMKSTIEQSFHFYPENPVKIGDSWDMQIELNQGFPIKGLYNYKLVKVEGAKAFLDVKGRLTTDSTSKTNRMGMEMLAALAGDMTGSMEVDLVSGMPLIGNILLKLKGNMEVGDQKVPMVTTSEAIMKVGRQ